MVITAAELQAKVSVAGAKQTEAELKAVAGQFDKVGAAAKGSASGFGAAEAATRGTTASLTVLDSAAKNAGGSFKQNALQVLGIGSAMGVATVATTALIGGLKNAAVGLFNMHAQAENVEAQLTAFTGSSREAEAVLADLRAEAATTAFSFTDMAKAAVSLVPASKQSGESLMGLIEVAEMLAAINPAEGLAGAAYALREALSGDYQSVIDRFNLSREAINNLKAQGVPALQAITKVLADMGVDMSVVSGLSQTTTGRLSNLFDSIQQGAMVVTAPFFDKLSEGIGDVAEAAASPEYTDSMQEWAEATQLAADAMDHLARESLPPVVDGISAVAALVGPIAKVVGVWSDLNTAIRDIPVVGTIVEWSSPLHTFKLGMDMTIGAVELLGAGLNKLPFVDVGEEGSTAFGHIADAAREAITVVDELAAAQQKYLDLVTRDVGAGGNTGSQAEGMRNLSAATQEYTLILADQAEAAGKANEANERSIDVFAGVTQESAKAAFATDKLTEAQNALAEAYQIGLDIQRQYTAQGSEYTTQAGLIEQAIEVVNQRVADGTATQEDYNFILANGEAAIERYKGGVDDATISAGEYAIKNALIIAAQDTINQQFPHLVEGTAEYNEKLKEAAIAAGLTAEEFDGMTSSAGGTQTALEGIKTAITDTLVPAIEDLTRKVEYISKPWLITIDAATEAAEQELLRILDLIAAINNSNVAPYLDPNKPGPQARPDLPYLPVPLPHPGDPTIPGSQLGGGYQGAPLPPGEVGVPIDNAYVNPLSQLGNLSNGQSLGNAGGAGRFRGTYDQSYAKTIDTVGGLADSIDALNQTIIETQAPASSTPTYQGGAYAGYGSTVGPGDAAYAAKHGAMMTSMGEYAYKPMDHAGSGGVDIFTDGIRMGRMDIDGRMMSMLMGWRHRREAFSLRDPAGACQ